MDQINRRSECFTFDPSISGFDSAFWKTLSGTPSISSNKLRLNTAEIASYVTFREPDVEFVVNVPVQPTSGDVRAWGLKIPALGNRARIEFDITGAVFSCKAYDNDGTVQINQTITWNNTDWSNAAIKYRIIASTNGIRFFVNGICVAKGEMTGLTPNNSVPSLAAYLHVVNGNADNLDISAVTIKDAQLVSTTFRPGPSLDSNGNTKVAEQRVPQSEDLTNNVKAVAIKPGVSTYAWTMDRSLGAVTKRNVKASAGWVGRIFASNRNAALRYFQIFAKATAPAGGDVPLESYEIPIGSALVLDTTHFGLHGMDVATGVSWAISTTNATFTDSATASEHNVYLGWK